MKRIKLYNQFNESLSSDVNNFIIKSKKDFDVRIKDCVLYLIDNYENQLGFINTSYDEYGEYVSIEDTKYYQEYNCWFSISISDDRSELFDLLNRTVDRIKSEFSDISIEIKLINTLIYSDNAVKSWNINLLDYDIHKNHIDKIIQNDYDVDIYLYL